MSPGPAAYDRIGVGYATRRQPDPRIDRQIREALGCADSVLNVGAGTGSYEPRHVPTVALEPSAEMIAQRRVRSNVVRGAAEALPFEDGCFDASLAVLTLHHWRDIGRGLAECVRVSRRRVVILTWDPDSPGFWLTRDYFPRLLAFDRDIFPSLNEITNQLGPTSIREVPIPADCLDGFLGAYWRRPEAYLRAEVRSSISSFARSPHPAETLERLRADLESGAWRARNSEVLGLESLDLGYRLVTAMLG